MKYHSPMAATPFSFALVIVIASALVSGCVSYSPSQPVAINSSSRVVDGRLVTDRSTEPGENVVQQTEKPTGAGDLVRKTFADGSGHFGPSGGDVLDQMLNWTFSVRSDEMTEKKVVTVYRKGYVQIDSMPGKKLPATLGLFLDLSKVGSESACVLGHDFPGKRAMIRADSNTAIETDQEGCTRLTKGLDAQFRTGRIAKVRGYEWPYDYSKTFDVDLSGYSDVVDYLRKQR